MEENFDQMVSEEERHNYNTPQQTWAGAEAHSTLLEVMTHSFIVRATFM